MIIIELFYSNNIFVKPNEKCWITMIIKQK